MKDIHIYSDIGQFFFSEGFTDQMMVNELKDADGDEVTVHINSSGGDVFQGFAIFNLLKQYEGKVTTQIDGSALSAASIIACAGAERLIAENALIMIHEPWSGAVGNSTDFRSAADSLDKIKDSIVQTYVSNTKLKADELTTMMEGEEWFNAEEAIAAGFATATTATSQQVANFSKPWIRNEPPRTKIADIAMGEEFRMALNRRRLALAQCE